MPLPASNTPWPPKEWNPVFADMRRWEAWWIGDTTGLWDVHHQAQQQQRPSRRGLAGFVERFFWGRQTTNGVNRPSRGDLHIPIASDLCATSADLLYGTPPKIATPTSATNDQIERYRDEGLFEQLLSGAETGSALGGRYQRVTWDPQILDRPFLSTVDSDSALPEFRWGRMVAVTFWTILERTGNVVWRHLERHELDPQGNGWTFHGLYEGTDDNLGMLRPLTEHQSTAPLAQVVVEDHVAQGITPGLNVVYVPNVTPQRRWRHTTNAKDLGRSDLDGIEGLMDALDETYSSWMRDLRLGKARVFADRSMLEDRAPGGGERTFDLDQEIFVPLDGLSGSMANQLPIQAEQFAIRVQEHADTAADLVRRIIRGARYSAATFGDDVQDTDVTATEVKARQAATGSTRDRKIRLEKPALQALIVKMLRTDQAIFNTPGLNPTDLAVDFPPLVQQTTEGNAQTVATLKSAGALSLQVAVEMAHPDWDQTQVEEEVDRIQSEQPITSPDQWRPNPTELTDDEDEDPGDAGSE